MFHLCFDAQLWLRERLAQIQLKHRCAEFTARSLSWIEGEQLLGTRLNAELIRWLRSKLQRTPTWSHGHIRLSQLALAADNLALGYASAQAAVLLCKHSRQSVRLEAALQLARCFNRRGAFDHALQALAPFMPMAKGNLTLCEELSAAYLGAGNFAEVVSLLSGVGRENLSSGSLAALDFASSKLN